MQLGTRWRVGTEPPGTLPAAVLPVVREVEAELRDTEGSSSWSWTLTWLENSPVAELDDGTVIRYDQVSNTARVSVWSEEGEPDESDPSAE